MKSNTFENLIGCAGLVVAFCVAGFWGLVIAALYKYMFS